MYIHVGTNIAQQWECEDLGRFQGISHSLVQRGDFLYV